MSYLNGYNNTPVKLSVIVASLLAASCANMNMRDGIFDEQTEITKEASDVQAIPLADVSNSEFDTLNPDTPELLLAEKANKAFKKKKYSKALEHWEQLITQSPDYAPAYVGYSHAGRKMNLHQKILSKLYDFKNRFPKDATIIEEIAKVHYELKDYDQALEEVDSATKIQDSNWKLYSLRGVISDKLNYYSEAEASYNKALELSPNNSTILNNFAVSMMLNGKYDEAELYVTNALSDPNVNPQAYRTYAKILALKGEGNRAEPLLTKKLKDKDKAQEIIKSARIEVSKPALWGRK